MDFCVSPLRLVFVPPASLSLYVGVGESFVCLRSVRETAPSSSGQLVLRVLTGARIESFGTWFFTLVLSLWLGVFHVSSMQFRRRLRCHVGSFSLALMDVLSILAQIQFVTVSDIGLICCSRKFRVSDCRLSDWQTCVRPVLPDGSQRWMAQRRRAISLFLEWLMGSRLTLQRSC